MSGVNIRHYRDSDFEEICSWWKSHHECPPLPGMMTPDSTFVLEINETPVMTLSVFMTKSREISYLEGYCAHPGLPKEVRNELGELLWEHCFKFLRTHGRKRAIALTDKTSLVKRYQKFGMKPGLSGLHSLAKEL